MPETDTQSAAPSKTPAQSVAQDPDYGRAATDAREILRDGPVPTEPGPLDRGIDQVLRLWRPEDGDPEALKNFLTDEFLQGPEREETFSRLEFAFERLDGYNTSLIRDLNRGADLEIGPMLPIDERLAAWSPGAHVNDDLFANKIAFVVLLNFPLTSLTERLEHGGSWTRRQWAETRLAERFQSRVPAEVTQGISTARTEAGSYIDAYNIYMHHLLTEDGRRLFPEGLRLISHWGLRDELKARYADPEGLEKQRMIRGVMERIVRQEIPAQVINNPLYDWFPESNRVVATSVERIAVPGNVPAPTSDREPDTRYARWFSVFRAIKEADPYHPDNPTWIDRRFNVNREIPEAEVEALFEAVLSSPLGAQVGRLVQERLGRPLEPFDIWYVGFKPRGRYTEAELDAITRERYPTAEAYARDMPRMLQELGFSNRRARFLSERIVVEPSRGAGHAFGPGRRDDNAHLRTRVGEQGMDYKGYNIAVHEMGHNVEQVISMATIDHTLLQGVPNTAFTEALAFVFQAQDLRLLGLTRDHPTEEALRVLETFWATREIAAVALVDMRVWRWLYEHPSATPAEFREAVVGIAQDVWNRYFAPVFGISDVPLLAVYSHMVGGAMYTPDYPLGYLIAFQVEAHFKNLEGPMGEEFERICRLGRLTPDAWMRQAVGSPLSAEPLLRATEETLGRME
jgi:hypothetical protein